MRLSTSQIFQQGISAILDQQSALQQTSQQLNTGRRVLTPSDDPAAAVQILDITEDLELVEQYQRNASQARGQLGLEEQALTGVGNLLQRVRELVVQANNATQTPETRSAIATEINARVDELVALANTRDANDEYIFAGFQSASQPFSRQGDSVSFTGDSGQRFVNIGNGIQLATRDSGRDIFVAVPDGNGTFTVAPGAANTGTAVAGENTVDGSFVADSYSITFSQPTAADPVTYQVTDSSAAVVATGNYAAGDTITFAGVSIAFEGSPADGDAFQVAPSSSQDLFRSLQNIVNSLNAADGSATSNAAVNNALNQGLNNLDQGIGHILEVRAEVGVRLSQLDNQQNLNENFTLQLRQTLSDVQDVDYAEAISRLNAQLTALQAAQQAYVRAQGLSIFNFL